MRGKRRKRLLSRKNTALKIQGLVIFYFNYFFNEIDIIEASLVGEEREKLLEIAKKKSKYSYLEKREK